jgi:hypothetical protein
MTATRVTIGQPSGASLMEGHTGKHLRSFRKLGKHGKQGEVVVEWDRNIDDCEEPDEHEIGGQG